MYIRWPNPISMGISESYMRIISKALADVLERLGSLAEFVRCIEVIFVKVNGAIVPDFTVHIGTEVHPASFATQVPFAGSLPTYADVIRHFGTNGLLRGRILQHLSPPDYDSVVKGIRTAFQPRIK